jgi:hypothetical protein
MSENKKNGFFKRLFGGKKECNCGVQIQEIKDDVSEETDEDQESAGCCAKETATK